MKNNFLKKFITLFLNSVIIDAVRLSHQQNLRIDLSVNEMTLNSYIEKINNLISFNQKLLDHQTLEYKTRQLLLHTLENLNMIIDKKNTYNLVKKIIHIQKQLDTIWCSKKGIENS